MDSKTNKIYHKHGFDSRQHLEHYFSDKPDMVFEEDFLKFPIENLTKTFTDGHIKGDLLIDICIGSMVHQLYAACEFFNNIVVLKVKDRCIMELKRWVDTRTGAFHWSHATQLHIDTEEKSAQLQDKEKKMKLAIQHVVKYDLEKENIVEPVVLPLADCIISAWLLDVVSKDQDDYVRYLKKFTRMLKPGGHIVLIGVLDATYFTVGKDKLHIFTYNEDFARKTIIGEGFIVDYCKVWKRIAVSDLIDHKGVLFLVAHKDK